MFGIILKELSQAFMQYVQHPELPWDFIKDIAEDLVAEKEEPAVGVALLPKAHSLRGLDIIILDFVRVVEQVADPGYAKQVAQARSELLP
jgi:hypothetical protein